MSPRDSSDPLVDAIDRLSEKVDALAVRVADHEKRLRWIVSVALLVVGAVGGPDAVQLITGGAA